MSRTVRLDWVTLALLVTATPCLAWPDQAEAVPTGDHGRRYAESLGELGFGAPRSVTSARWRPRGRAVRVELTGLTVERCRFDSPQAAAEYMASASFPAPAHVERRGDQLVILSGPAAARPASLAEAAARAWAVLPGPEASADRSVLTTLPPTPSEPDPGLPLPSRDREREPARDQPASAPITAAPSTAAGTTAEPSEERHAAPSAAGHGARALVAHYLLGEDLHPLAREGHLYMVQQTQAHRDAIARTGVGLYFGDHSSYARKSPEQRAAWVSEHATVAGPLPMPRESSCIGWALESVGAAYEAAGRGAVWQGIKQRVVAKGSMGTVLAQELVADGWQAIYFNPDPAKDADGNAEHSYTARLVRKGKPYYKIPVSGEVTGYRPAPGSRTVRDTSGLERLAKVPFWFGLARGGVHTFVGHGKVVNEFHWSAMPNDPEAIEDTPLEEFAWLSGVIVVPPSTWPTRQFAGD